MRNRSFFFESDKIYCRFPCNRLLKVHFRVFPFENTFSVSKGWFRVFRPFSAIAENHRPYVPLIIRGPRIRLFRDIFIGLGMPVIAGLSASGTELGLGVWFNLGQGPVSQRLAINRTMDINRSSMANRVELAINRNPLGFNFNFFFKPLLRL